MLQLSMHIDLQGIGSLFLRLREEHLNSSLEQVPSS